MNINIIWFDCFIIKLNNKLLVINNVTEIISKVDNETTFYEYNIN